MKRIVVTGSESVGKTTLAHRLGEHFGVPVAAEFVRGYAAQRGGKLGFNDHGPIARGQMASEDAATARAKDIVILDTDLVSTVVYCEHYFKMCPEWIKEEAAKRASGLYILLKPDIPWVADGVRDRGTRREEMHELFAAKLREMKLVFVELGGEGDERLAAAIKAISTADYNYRVSL
jgi:NadR type nicotinamide-nucleotide adenylyltransferase